MTIDIGFTFSRFAAVVYKEFIQMRRDRVTFAMMIGIPLMQLILFGYAINSDPRHLPTAVLSADNSPYSRGIVAGMQTSTYFDVTGQLSSRAQAEAALKNGDAQFVLTIPEDFSRKLLRGETPVLLLEADATDPAATSGAVASLREIVSRAIARDLPGPAAELAATDLPVTIRVHAEYNPEAVTQYNIVPGLMGVILSLTLTMITSLAITRERERGTMENLLSTPVKPLEVMLGKITPYILVGYIQIALIILASKFLFDVPLRGSLVPIFVLSLVFIAANLSVGVTLSTVAKNQLQAVQMSVFFFLPSLLLSGFMFPFRGMPAWAQVLGSALPLTHYLRFVRGVLLKGATGMESLTHIWPIAIFFLAVIAIGMLRYRKTLD
ncbi:MAG: mannose-1-phosphate guanyltransferase [Desulfovibrionaceae bacterium CG1_02_65_16]|nr:MAG: mannose-1-phosphate guanyltransferase [Desulfovibrionaceae bacterium CG1_02_65_16]